MTAGGPCALCGKDPAEGYASIWTATEGERWFCHGDDGPSCYAGDLASHSYAVPTTYVIDLRGTND